MALCAAGLLLISGLTAGSSWRDVALGLAVAGAGAGLANPAMTAAALGALDPTRGGLASGVQNTFRQLGLAVGVGALGAAFTARLDRMDRRLAGRR
jgi:hypothetical protein